MDDWILSNLNIPSITNELGRDSQYSGEWQVKSKEDAFSILQENTQWLQHLYSKLGAQLKIEPIYYEPTETKNQVNLAI